jgi:branched-chain amino acid transport system ATP-binding protein
LTSALSLRSLTVRYGDVVALRGIDLDIPPACCFAILGANGAGKSSLVGAVAGLVTPAAGRMLLDGRPLGPLAAEERARLGIGTCLEGRRLFVDLTTDENLRAATLVLPVKRRGAALDNVYSLFPRLAERRRQRVGTLSGGEQQMLALGRVLVRDLRVLLLDEPSLGLAPWLAEEIMARVWQLPRRGTAVVIAEQNTSVLPDRSIPSCLLANGEIVAEGALQDVAALDAAAIQARPRRVPSGTPNDAFLEEAFP